MAFRTSSRRERSPDGADDWQETTCPSGVTDILRQVASPASGVVARAATWRSTFVSCHRSSSRKATNSPSTVSSPVFIAAAEPRFAPCSMQRTRS
jgi:hypothetical protein